MAQAQAQAQAPAEIPASASPAAEPVQTTAEPVTVAPVVQVMGQDETQKAKNAEALADAFSKILHQGEEKPKPDDPVGQGARALSMFGRALDFLSPDEPEDRRR